MSDQNISHDSSDAKSNQIKGNLMVAGVAILGGATLVICAFGVLT